MLASLGLPYRKINALAKKYPTSFRIRNRNYQMKMQMPYSNPEFVPKRKASPPPTLSVGDTFLQSR